MKMLLRGTLSRLLLMSSVWCTGQVVAQPGVVDDGRQEAGAQPLPVASMTIATRQAPPFAFKGADGQWSGIAIELWNRIAEQNRFDFRYVELGLTEMLDAVSAGRVDGAAAALTITSDRERIIDFSHPFHSSGLAIAVPYRDTNPLPLITRFISPAFLAVVGALLALLIVVGILIWLAERRGNAQFRKAPLSGIGAGLWWSAVTMTTVGYGDKAPTSILGRMIAMVWMFAGLIVISTFTAAITTALTVNELDASIDGIDDLRLKRVVALAGSTSESFLADEGIRDRTVASLPEALGQLASGQADAVVHDAPILRYEVRERFPQQLRVLPFVLRHQAYGIALPPGSDIREPVNVALIEIIRSNDWSSLLEGYLGRDY